MMAACTRPDPLYSLIRFLIPVTYATQNLAFGSKGAFFWAYSGIGIVGISQTIVHSRATLIPEWL